MTDIAALLGTEADNLLGHVCKTIPKPVSYTHLTLPTSDLV